MLSSQDKKYWEYIYFGVKIQQISILQIDIIYVSIWKRRIKYAKENKYYYIYIINIFNCVL